MFDSSSVGESQDGGVQSSIPPDRPVPEWRLLDQRLRTYARHRCELDAAESFDLVRAKTMKLHALVGCATHWEYMERVLGYGSHAARERMRVANKISTLPLIAAEFARGERTYSAVRALTRVATPETETAWLAATKGKHGGQIERAVRGRAPGDLPTDPTRPDLRTRDLGLQLPPDHLAMWRQVRARVAADMGHEVSDAEVQAVLMRHYLDPSGSKAGPPHQIAYKQCLDCKRVTQNGAGQEIEVEPHVLERAACDATNLGSLDASTPERITKSITPRLRDQIFARDDHSCRVPGCRSSRNLDIHHIVPRCRGGSNALWNLILLCSGHHAALHAGLLTITGRAPHDVQVAWVYQPLPLNLDASARKRFLTRQVAELFHGPLPDDWVPPGTDDLDPSDRDYDPVWHDPAFVRRPTARANVGCPRGDVGRHSRLTMNVDVPAGTSPVGPATDDRIATAIPCGTTQPSGSGAGAGCDVPAGTLNTIARRTRRGGSRRGRSGSGTRD